MKTNFIKSEEGLAALSRFLFMALMAVTVYVMTDSAAYATAGDGIKTAIGNAAATAAALLPSLGTLAIIALGITAMFGRITWTQALIVAVGIAIATSAHLLYNDINGPLGGEADVPRR